MARSCPSTFLALKVQLVVLVSAFVQFSQFLVCCSSTHGAPPPCENEGAARCHCFTLHSVILSLPKPVSQFPRSVVRDHSLPVDECWRLRRSVGAGAVGTTAAPLDAPPVAEGVFMPASQRSAVMNPGIIFTSRLPPSSALACVALDVSANARLRTVHLFRARLIVWTAQNRFEFRVQSVPAVRGRQGRVKQCSNMFGRTRARHTLGVPTRGPKTTFMRSKVPICKNV